MAGDYKYYKNNPKLYVMEYKGTEPEEEYNPDLVKESISETPQALIINTSPFPTHFT
jgi:hypothetical protein